MVHITNTQRVYPINVPLLAAAAQAMLDALEYSSFDLGILICGTTLMRQYNADYRHKDKPTDVLSFPFYPELKPDQRITPENPDDANLGDIILCPAIIDKKRKEWERGFDDHCIVLIAHATAHLLGHDHEDDADYVRMQAVEDTLLAAVRHLQQQ